MTEIALALVTSVRHAQWKFVTVHQLLHFVNSHILIRNVSLQLCVGNDTNDAIIGELGGIPPIVSLLSSGLDNILMVKAVTAFMHLLRDDSYNKITFCKCGGELNLSSAVCKNIRHEINSTRSTYPVWLHILLSVLIGIEQNHLVLSLPN